jgi:hypothetical protein
VGRSAAGQTLTRVSAVLCFAEFYNGAWQPVKTSDVGDPIDLGTWTAGMFDRTKLRIRPWHSADATDESLYVQITSDSMFPAANWYWYRYLDFYDWKWSAGFVLHNTHSAPVPWPDAPGAFLQPPDRARILHTSAPTSPAGGVAFSVRYGTTDTPGGGYLESDFTGLGKRPILTGSLPQTVTAAQHDVVDQWSMPFFFADHRNAFYVTTSTWTRWVSQYVGFGASGPAGPAARADIPPLVLGPRPTDPGGPYELVGELADPEQGQRAVGDGHALRVGLASGELVSYQGREVGATGSTAPQQLNIPTGEHQ